MAKKKSGKKSSKASSQNSNGHSVAGQAEEEVYTNSIEDSTGTSEQQNTKEAEPKEDAPERSVNSNNTIAPEHAASVKPPTFGLRDEQQQNNNNATKPQDHQGKPTEDSMEATEAEENSSSTERSSDKEMLHDLSTSPKLEATQKRVHSENNGEADQELKASNRSASTSNSAANINSPALDSSLDDSLDKNTEKSTGVEESMGNLNVESESKVSAKDIIKRIQAQLEQAESERDEIQEEYDNLLEKVGTIKQRLGEKFKELEAEADSARKEAGDALKQKEEAQNLLKELQEKAALDAKDLEALKKQQVSQKIMFDQELANETMSKQSLELELEQLKTKCGTTESILSQTVKQSEQQIAELDKLRAELRTTKEAQDALQAKLESETKAHEKDHDERVQEISQLQTQLASIAQASASSSKRQLQLETEAKENQLLIGKLRHEAVILNDHLTHALRIVRKDSEGSTVDKELVSNLFVQFATCPRQDTKKFEILLLIANFLGWDDQRRQAVGLAKGDQTFDMMQQNQQQGQQPQMVGVVGKLAEFLENRRANK